MRCIREMREMYHVGALLRRFSLQTAYLTRLADATGRTQSEPGQVRPQGRAWHGAARARARPIPEACLCLRSGQGVAFILLLAVVVLSDRFLLARLHCVTCKCTYRFVQKYCVNFCQNHCPSLNTYLCDFTV